MKWIRLIFLSLPVLILSACQREIIVEPKGLQITIEFPATTLSKSAADDEFPAEQDENTIKDLKIWVFKHAVDANNEHKRLAYLELGPEDGDDFPMDGVVKQYVLTVEDSQFSVERPKVDVFVLVNSASIGCSSLNKASGWSDVKDATFKGNYFAPGETAYKSVPSDGLPMSACGLNLSIQGEDPSLKVQTITLRRCVSKVQFFFSQTRTEGNDSESVTINSIKLNSKLIPVGEYVFSANGKPAIAAGGYVDEETVLAGPDGPIRKSEAPELYAYAGQDGVSYRELLQYGVKSVDNGGAGEVTPGGVLYLRESDLKLEGEITYTVTVNGVLSERHQKFSMKAPGEFSRNHCWIVYGYFISNRTLQLSVHVLDWDMNRYTIEFKESSLMVTQKLMVDRQTVASYVSWADSEEHKDNPDKNQFDVTLYSSKPARAYLYVTTPKSGSLQIYKVGSDARYFSVTEDAPIDADTNMGRIDIFISKSEDYDENLSGKTITLSFKAFTNDERPVGGEREFVDQIFHFILP